MNTELHDLQGVAEVRSLLVGLNSDECLLNNSEVPPLFSGGGAKGKGVLRIQNVELAQPAFAGRWVLTE